MTAERRNILIVDDHEPARMLLGRIVLQELGARVTLAGTCEEALRLASATIYDAILLDLVMPGIGGQEVLRRIRAAGANRATPVVVVSVMSDHDSVERCRALGATAFLAKPIDRERVGLTLRTLLVPQDDKAQARERATLYASVR